MRIWDQISCTFNMHLDLLLDREIELVIIPDVIEDAPKEVRESYLFRQYQQWCRENDVPVNGLDF